MNCTIIELPGIKIDTINYNRAVIIVKLADVSDMDKNDDLLALMMCLINGGLCKIIFDLVSVEFIDSYGIGTIVEIVKYIRQHHNGDVVLINVSERILLIFKPIQFQKFIKIFHSEDEALHYFQFV